MEPTITKGTTSREIVSIEVLDYNIATIVIDALTEKGYDVELKSLKDNNNYVVGERITVYKKGFR